MLEVKELTKIYKGKKGASVHALDGVSLKFPERGMVFLLGKSGSGKSTLLNVCGGLDSPTSGEIIVKGRSSRSFSGSDFDSYRNTYVGFIFQEYNILNEFSVEDNIALAVELQGKSKRKRRKEIRDLLEQVDLKGYARRKPNTLSGGQKQRIAIARALVKNPEIIMADEPTGALDSATGKQVLDTLKKLSQDKLVIIVSHDREFAETYADRIIELKDGKVISDVSKTELEQMTVSENIHVVDNVLCIKSGTELTDGDFEKIKGFLKDADKDVIIAKDETDVRNFKKSSRITDSGNKEVFADTDEAVIEYKEYTPKDSKFIRSKLPMRHAIKIGVSGMKRKPFRLLATVSLCTVAFILFGVLSTLSFYSSESIFKETLPNTDISMVSVSKLYSTEETYYQNGEKLSSLNSYERGKFGTAELEKLESEYGVEAFGACPLYTSYDLKETKSSYWHNEIGGVAYIPEGHSLRAEENIVAGAYPQRDNQLAISSYAADMLIAAGFYNAKGIEIAPKSYGDLIGKTINLNNSGFEIVGIIAGEPIPEKYDKLKDDAGGNSNNLYKEYMNLLSDGTHLLVFSTDSYIRNTLNASSIGYAKGDHRQVAADIYVTGTDEISIPDWANATYMSLSESENNILSECAWVNAPKTTLGSNEAVISDSLLVRMLLDHINKLDFPTDEETSMRVSETTRLLSALSEGGVYEYAEGETEPTFNSLTEKETEETLKQLLKLLDELNIDLRMGFSVRNDTGDTSRYGESFNIVGVYISGGLSGDMTPIILSDADYGKVWELHKSILDFYSVIETDYKAPEDDIYEIAYFSYDGSEKVTNMLWDIYDSEDFDENSQRLMVSSSFISTLEVADSIADLLSTVFMWVGIILAVFAALLFSNFISTSISHKKREIGILRAVGARGFDVFKIFFSESAIISVICVLLSTAGSIAVCAILNNALTEGIGVSLFVFGPLSFLVLVAIACLTAVVATFLPVFNAARKKPVDSIRAV